MGGCTHHFKLFGVIFCEQMHINIWEMQTRLGWRCKIEGYSVLLESVVALPVVSKSKLVLPQIFNPRNQMSSGNEVFEMSNEMRSFSLLWNWTIPQNNSWTFILDTMIGISMWKNGKKHHHCKFVKSWKLAQRTSANPKSHHLEAGCPLQPVYLQTAYITCKSQNLGLCMNWKTHWLIVLCDTQTNYLMWGHCSPQGIHHGTPSGAHWINFVVGHFLCQLQFLSDLHVDGAMKLQEGCPLLQFYLSPSAADPQRVSPPWKPLLR